MAFTPVYSSTITNLKARVAQLASHPTHIARAKLEHLSEVSGGVINFIDPTSPWAFNFESSSVAVAAAVEEMNANMRKLYPKLAVTESDLYKHMSDVDYAYRFASPATCEFYIAIPIDDIRLRSHEYTIGSFTYRDLMIPKSSYISVGGYTFTFEYGIILRTIQPNGEANDAGLVKQILSVFYDTTTISPLQSLSTNIIDYEVRIDRDGKQWVYFKTPLLQTQITPTTDVIHSSALFSKTIAFTDQFCYLRAFFKNNNTSNQWREFTVTHSDDVFDATIPTLLVQKLKGEVQVTLPLVYSTAGMSGDILIMVYTTKGSLSIDMSTYLINDYVCTISDTFNQFTDKTSNSYKSLQAMNKSSYYTFSIQKFSGGSTELDLATLRHSVIYDTLGDRKLPITNVQLAANEITKEGFELVKNIDVLTNRVYLAVRKLPQPTQTNILTAANFGIAPATFQFSTLDSYQKEFALNGARATLKSGALFNDNNGVISLVKSQDYAAAIHNKTLQEVATYINSQQFVYNPYYYVLDSSGEEFVARAYSLDNPSAGMLSFDKADSKYPIAVATDKCIVTHDRDKGAFIVQIYVTGSSDYATLLSNDGNTNSDDLATYLDDKVQLQLSLFDVDSSRWVYYKGVPVADSEGAFKCFEVTLNINYDLNEDSAMCLIDAAPNMQLAQKAYVDLMSKARIVHIVKTPVTVGTLGEPILKDEYNTEMVGINSADMVPVSMQTVTLTFGHHLKKLWSRTRSFKTDAIYKRYVANVYQTYPADVYQEDAYGKTFTVVNGEPVFTKLHSAGDQILDNGQPILLHRAGDIMMDAYNSPVLVDEPLRSTIGLDRELDILFVDGKYLKATSTGATSYRSEISNLMVSWITQNIQRLQDVLIDQSNIYFYPKTTLAKISAWIDDKQDTVIDAEQALKIDLYVTSRIYTSEELRQSLLKSTILTIDKFIDKSYVSVSDIMAQLRQTYNDEVKGLKLWGLGGDNNDFQVLYLKDDYNRMCLKKKLVAKADGTLDVTEDITVSFYNVDRVTGN